MKKVIVVMGMILISFPLFAGQKEGNGGGVWTCKKWNDEKHYYDYTLIEFVDLYEGREEFHLNIPQRLSQNYSAILEEIKGSLLEVNEEFGEMLSQYIVDIVSSMTFTNAELKIIDDALYRIQPPESSCRDGMVTYRQLANFTHYNKTLIQKTLWEDETFSELGRAALIVHEALYKYARETKKDENSVRTREAVAHIFSDMDKDSLRKKLLNDGWFNSEPINPPADPEKRMTNTGAVFIRDRSHAALGEAWRDPAGLIWGDIVKNEDGTVRYMVQSSTFMKEIDRPLPEGVLGAKEHCESIGTRLPSKEEFTQLREYMGALPETREGYRAQVLPNLDYSGHFFWSLSVKPGNIYEASGF